MRQKSIKNIRKEFKEQGVFYTPPKLAEKLLLYVDIVPKTVYDPTCGAGNLLGVFPNEVKKYGQELDKEQLESIELPNFIGFYGDTLEDDKFPNMQFDCIVANPPFSVKWNPNNLINDIRFKDCPALPPPSKADWAFMLHILYHLSNDGVAVVLEFPGILYRGQKEAKVRKWFVENNYIDRIVNVPSNTFEDTSISTCILVLKKNRKNTDIAFEDGEVVKKVSKKEIEDNGFILSVSTYIQEEIEKECINPIELENEARTKFLKKLRKELNFEKMVCEMEGLSMKPFLEEIKEVVREFED